MNPTQNCLQTALYQKAQEVLFQAQHPIRFRIGKELVPMSSQPTSAQDLRVLVSQLLTEDERKTLFENRKIEGVKAFGSVSFKFDFQIDFEGVQGSLMFQGTATPWNLPGIVNESVARSQGLSLITGPRKSGKTSVIQQVLQSLSQRKKVIASYSDEANPHLKSEGNFLTQFSVQHLQKNGVLRTADIVILDSSRLEFCETALRLAEEGRSVVLTLPVWGISMGLQRFMDLCEGSADSRARRTASVLQMAMGLRLLQGIETSLQGAFELLLADSQIQKAVASSNFQEITNLMKTTGEKTGMRSLNQSLFQLLMKRKVDLKSAFENSPEPEELDSLLKKVGI